MIRININGLDFEQDIRPLVKSFYKDDEIVVRHGADSDPCVFFDEEDSFDKTLQLDSDNNSFSLIWKDKLELREEEEFRALTGDKLEDRKLMRNQLLRALYRMLKQTTNKDLPWGTLTGVRPTKLVYEKYEESIKNNTLDTFDADIYDYMSKVYYCSEEKIKLAKSVAVREKTLLDQIDYSKGYSLYIDIPFCPSICSYCSFSSHPYDKNKKLVEPYIAALKKEIEYASTCFPDKKLQTIYFGGGTPTSISAEQLREIILHIKEFFDISSVVEFTVEAGRPDSITPEKLKMLKEEGVTRISVNPQSMVARTLEVIGRKHSVEDVYKAFNMAREAGFDNINMDIIIGLTGENEDDVKYTLNEIEKLDPDSLTVHTLAIKRAARLNTEKGLYKGMEASGVLMMQKNTEDYALSHNYLPYYMYRQKNMAENLENVGYSKYGKEGLYNILIMEEKQIILALGAGASSKFVFEGEERFERVENVKGVVEYIDRIDEMIERKKSFLAQYRRFL